MASCTRSKFKTPDVNLEESGDDCPPLSPHRVITDATSSKKKRKLNSTTKRSSDGIGLIDETAEQLGQFLNTNLSIQDVIESEAAKYFGAPPSAKKKDNVKSNTSDVSPPPPLSIESVMKCFDEKDSMAEKMEKKHVDSFDTWMLYLVENMNVLLHGFGSKLDLLERFRRDQLVANDYTHLVVHGYRPDANVKDLLTILEQNLIVSNGTTEVRNNVIGGGGGGSTRVGLVQRALRIRDALNAGDGPVVDFVIIVHSIDGIALRDEQQQTALSFLAQAKQCRIIASADHVNASLLWDGEKASRFRWLWIDAGTYANYRAEIVDGHGSKILGIRKSGAASNASAANSRGHTLSGLRSIWSSLNEKARKIFILLAERQLSSPAGRNRGRQRLAALMTYWQLYEQCRDAFLVSNEANLKQILNEFYDHQILENKINDEDQEALHVPVGDDLLTEFLSGQGITLLAKKNNGEASTTNDKATTADDNVTTDSSTDDDSSDSSSEDGENTEEEDDNDNDDACSDIL